MYVSVAIVRSVADELRRRDVPLQDFCREAGLRLEELYDACLLIRMDRYIGAMRVAGRLAHDPTFALHAGASAPPHVHLISQIAKLCGSMKESLAFVEKYGDLIFEGARFGLEESGDEARFTFDHPCGNWKVTASEAEGCLAFFVAVGRAFDGDQHPRRVRFAHPRRHDADIEEYRRVFRCDVEFDTGVNQIVFDRKHLYVQSPHRDADLHAILIEHLERLVDSRTNGSQFVQRVRDLLRYETDFAHYAGAREIAERLGISQRELQRRLRGQGVYLADLVDEARRDSACAALADPSVTIYQISDRLGFSEPSAFNRAFKRWTGVTPQKYRSST